MLHNREIVIFTSKYLAIQRVYKILILLLVLGPFTRLNAQTTDAVLSGETDSLFILNAFRIADDYMSTAQYDSAQVWLNKIHERVSYLQPSVFSYFLTARQAEVYYYNNLQQLGMQEAVRAVTIAETLNDSILRSDAYNFRGLFYTNTGRLKEAILYFKKGIAISSQPPYPTQYLEMSNPHHLYGNLAEAFEKGNEQDSAIYYGKISLSKAREIHHKRGTASALLSLGSSFLKKVQADSAAVFFESARMEAVADKDFDLKLTAYGGLACCASLNNKNDEAIAFLEKGFEILNDQPQLNSYYQLLFLEQAVALYKKHKLYEQLASSLQRTAEIQTATNSKNNDQYRSVLMTGLKNETRILNLEIERAKHGRVLATTRLYVVGLIILVMIAGFITYRYYSLQRLKMAHLRNKISQDLHDEVGATLSGIALYSYIAKEQNVKQEASAVTQSLDIIDKNATDMVKKLSDIVWAVNPEHDSLDALLYRLEDYAIEMGFAKGIEVRIVKEEKLQGLKLSMEQRKNIYLIIKEAVNNAIKYSECKHLRITVALNDKHLVIDVSDDGIGFSKSSSLKGNGLRNMQSRATDLHGKVNIESTPGNGTTINVICSIS